MKALFVIKERQVYGTKTACYGLVNSCQFVANALKRHHIPTEVVQVVDANGIDRVVTQHRPTHCFLEALWVTPSKIAELAPLHPKVHWVIRIHSMVPFLVGEGMSFDWLNEYTKLRHQGIKVSISANNIKLHQDLLALYSEVSYTPNIYEPDPQHKGDISSVFSGKHILNIGCFGALRILKNHCQQALWAIHFAEKMKKTLHFHVNVSNHETNETSPVLKNLRAIFQGRDHQLIEHTWSPHPDFVELVKQMDLGMQISFTETFNVVAADFVFNNVPIVVSPEIDFVGDGYKVDPSKPEKVQEALERAYNHRHDTHNKHLLTEHNTKAIKQWLTILPQIR